MTFVVARFHLGESDTTILGHVRNRGTGDCVVVGGKTAKRGLGDQSTSDRRAPVPADLTGRMN